MKRSKEPADAARQRMFDMLTGKLAEVIRKNQGDADGESQIAGAGPMVMVMEVEVDLTG